MKYKCKRGALQNILQMGHASASNAMPLTDNASNPIQQARALSLFMVVPVDVVNVRVYEELFVVDSAWYQL